MTLLNDAAAIYAGDVAAVAVYAGAVKVWPKPGPPPAFVGWDFAAGADGFQRSANEGETTDPAWTAADGGYLSKPVPAEGLSEGAGGLSLFGGPGAATSTRPESQEEPLGRTATALEEHGLAPGRTYTLRYIFRVTGPAATGVGARRVYVTTGGSFLVPDTAAPGWVPKRATVELASWAKDVPPDGQWRTFDLEPVVYAPPAAGEVDKHAWACWRPNLTLHVNAGGTDVRTLDLGRVEFIEVTP